MEENIKTRWAWRQILAVRPVRSYLFLSLVYNVKRALNYFNIHSESVWGKTEWTILEILGRGRFFQTILREIKFGIDWNLKVFLVLSPRPSWIYGKRQIHRNQIPSLLPLAHLVECKIGGKRECFMRESTTADQMLNLKYFCIQNQVLLDILQLRNIRKAPKRQARKPQPNKCPPEQEVTLLADFFFACYC